MMTENSDLINKITLIRHSLYDIDSIDIATARNQILSLLTYKFLSENSENNVEDIGYVLDEEYYYKNLLIDKDNVVETLKSGIEQITRNNNDIQSADVFYDLFDLLDFDILNNNMLLSFINIIDKLSRTTNSISDISSIIINRIIIGRSYNNFKPSEDLIQFFTLNQNNIKNIYDPHAVDGTLLVEIGKKINVENYYGQHPNKEKCIIAKMNLLMNNINYKNIFIKVNHINDPTPWDVKFDLCVSIPPFRSKETLNNNNNGDMRFKNCNLKRLTEHAYILDMLYNLNDDGTLYILVSDRSLRPMPNTNVIKYLVENGFIKNIIGLPRGLFDTSSIPTIILEIKKKTENNEIFYLNLRNSSTTRLPGSTIINDMDKYVKILMNKEEIELISKNVTLKDVIENEYNLSINRYIGHKMEIIDVDQTIENIRRLKIELKELNEEIEKEIGDLL